MAGREKSVIYEDLLLKNISKIEFYYTEENKSYDNLCKKLKDSLENYKSNTNTDPMFSKITDFENTINDILTKRQKYVDIEEKVIVLYHNLKNRTASNFTELGNIEEK